MKPFVRRFLQFLSVSAAVAGFEVSSQAVVFEFNSDPFAGSTALTTPGRQVVGGEPFITFDISQDVFSFRRAVFDLEGISLVNDEIGNVPATGVNVVVLRTFDNDADPTSPFNAGTAANLIAAQITETGPGFFIYFNQGLDLPRLVYSTDLSDNTADLKIMARLTNLGGQPGRDALANFSAANFTTHVPEVTSTLGLLLISVGALRFWRRKS